VGTVRPIAQIAAFLEEKAKSLLTPEPQSLCLAPRKQHVSGHQRPEREVADTKGISMKTATNASIATISDSTNSMFIRPDRVAGGAQER